MINIGFKDYCPDEKPAAGAFESDVDEDGDEKGEAPLEGVVEDVDEDWGAKGLVVDAPDFAGVDPGADGFLVSPGL